MKDKYIATIVGCGIGDSLGMSVEGWKKSQIEKYVGRVTELIAPVIVRDAEGKEVNEDEFGKLKYWTRDLSAGDITDDTILTIAIAESIVQKRNLDLNDMMGKQFEAYDKCIMPNGHVFGGFGRSTMVAFENFRKGISPLETGYYPGTGTGPCMKMAPLGLYMHATGKTDEGLTMARLIGRATHMDERAIATGVVQAEAVYRLLAGATRGEFIDGVVAFCEKNEKANPADFPNPEKGNLLSKLKWIKSNRDATSDEAKKVLRNSSLAIEAYPFTIFMFQKYWDNPIEGLIETVNYGGDCDTTGAMYGALCGAKNGMIFPNNWTTKLKEYPRLKNLGERMYSLGAQNV